MQKSVDKWFKECSDAEKKDINKIIYKEEIARRKEYYPTISETESELPWYFKTDYIKNFSLGDSNLEDFCPECNTTRRKAKFIKETGYTERTVTYECKCGCKFQTIN